MFAPRIVGLSGQVARNGFGGSASRLARTACASPRFLESFASYSSRTNWPVPGPSSSSQPYLSGSKPSTRPLSIGHLDRYSVNPAGSRSILGQITAFSTSTRQALRESYFRRPNGRSSSSGGGSGRGSGPGWFENLRRRIDRLPPMYVIYGIIGANVGIFLVWQYAQASWVSTCTNQGYSVLWVCWKLILHAGCFSTDPFPRSHSLPMDVAKLYRLRGEPGSGTAVSHYPQSYAQRAIRS
jgi:hypothetical protein